MKMKVNDFISKLNLALENKSYYARGAFGAPLTQAMKDRYNVPIAVDPSRFLFDCVGLGKACLGGWNADSNAVYGGTWAHTVNGALVYGEMDVPDLNETDFFNRCSDISTDFSNIVPGEAVWMTGHIGFYIGDGFAIEATPIWENGVQKTACNVSKPGYNRRTWTKHGKLPWVEYAEQPSPSYGYKYNGIDISRYQGDINFNELKGNVDFIISRTWIGKPMSADSTGDYDSKAFENWNGAISAGIPIQPYMLTYARDDESVREEVRSIKWWFANQPINTPRKIVWIDFENTGGINWADYSASDILHRFQLYYELLKQANIEMGIYSSRGPYWSTKLTDPWYDAHVLKWVAVYYSTSGSDLANDPNWNRSYSIWQSSSDGTVPGISARVDLDHSNVDLWGIEQQIDPSPTPDPDPIPDPATPPSTEEVAELHAQLYSFREKKEVINKLESDIESLWYGQIVPYNVVSSLSFAFSLSVIYPANYCRFKINGLQYFAYVEVRTLANGLYLYECSIDACTTAYYQGMLEGQTGTFLYSPTGKRLWKDPRVPTEKENEVVVKQLSYPGSNGSQDVVVLVIAERAYDSYETNQNPVLRPYVLRMDAWLACSNKIVSFSSINQRFYLPSLLKSYVIRNFPFALVWRLINSQGLLPRDVPLSLVGVASRDDTSNLIAYSALEIFGAINTETQLITPPNDAWISHNFRIDTMYSTTHETAVEKNAFYFNAKYHLYCPEVGEIDFKISDFITEKELRDYLVTIRLKEYFDLSGGNKIARPVIAGYDADDQLVFERELAEIQAIGSFSEQFPIMYNQNINNFGYLAATTTSAILQGVVGAASLASGDYLGGVLGVGRAVATGFNVEGRRESVRNGPTSVKGSVGGSPDRASGTNPYLWIENANEIDRSSFASVFGDPDGSTKLISTELQTAGYHQAGDVNVKANGYNESIVEGAKQALQSGFYVV